MEREKVSTGPTTITESHRESHLVTPDTVRELTHGVLKDNKVEKIPSELKYF